MRIAVYNRYWSTAGGGEVHAGSLAESLTRHHDVELLSEGDIDTAFLDAHLGTSLSGMRCRVLGEIDDRTFEDVTAEYDAFFNCTFSSTRRNRSRNGAYLVYFPPVDEMGVSPSSRVAATVARLLRSGLAVEWGEGVHPEEREGLRRWRWTEGEGHLRISVPPGRSAVLRLTLATAARPEGAEAPVEVSIGGTVVAHLPFTREAPHTLVTRVRGASEPIDVTIRTTPFRPRDLLGIDDPRTLGVQIERVELRNDALPHKVIRRIRPQLLSGDTDDYLETYRILLANSSYTADWVRRLWGRPSLRLEPPVRPRARNVKDRVILSVGRFFAPTSGHSKRQLEMVGAFRQLDRAGWELHLVGGCSVEDAAYLEEVRRAADGAPVVFHVNAPAEVVNGLYGRAAVYWQATGMNEDPAKRPERFEHFGISVVEAMSAGAVPVVLAVGGPAMTVRPNRDGLHFRNEAELIAATRRMVDDQALRERFSASAEERARSFDHAAFDRKVDRVLARMR